MFTGIVEELGEVVRLERSAGAARLTVRGPLVVSDAVPGASIAVNGCCLTVTEHDAETFTADVMLESLQRTVIGDLGPGDPVNLERPVRPDGRLGGHIVQGHVDATGRITQRVSTDSWDMLSIAVPADGIRYVVEKGSVAIDGVSLTVVEVRDGDAPWLSVSLIPETLARTTLGRKEPGDAVNLEFDVLAKYVERLVAVRATAGASASPAGEA